MSIRGYVIERIFIPQIEFAHAWVKERFLPTFANLEEEADRIADEHDSHSPGSEWDDPADAAERAFEAGLDFFMSARAFRQGWVSLLFVHLYHLVEQQLARVVRLGPAYQPGFKAGTIFEVLEEFFRLFKVDVTFLESWTLVDELRLIANTVKHADARDAEKLRKRRPELFIPKWAQGRDDASQFAERPLANWLASGRIEQAMAGKDFYPDTDEYDAKVSAVIAFWKEVAEVLDEKRHVKSLSDWVRKNRDRILGILAKHGASNVRVFGSVARGDAGPTSDVDFLVDFAPGTSLAAELRLIEELEEVLGRKVDVGTPAALKGSKKERILSEAIPL